MPGEGKLTEECLERERLVKEEVKRVREEKCKALLEKTMAEMKGLEEEEIKRKREKKWKVIQRRQKKMAEHEADVVERISEQRVAEQVKEEKVEAKERMDDLEKGPLLEDRRFGSWGRKRKSREIEKQLIKAEGFENEEVLRKNGMEWNSEMTKVLLEEDSPGGSRGVKRKSEEFMEHPLEENRLETGKLRRKSKNSLPTEPGELSLELGELKNDNMEDNEEHGNMNSIKNRNTDELAGREETDMALVESSLLSKLIDDMDDSSVDKFSHLILMELEEMEVVKTEEPSVEEAAREEEEAQKALEHYAAIETLEPVDTIVPEMFLELQNDSIALTDEPIQLNDVDLIQPRYRKILPKEQDTRFRRILPKEDQTNFDLWQMLTRGKTYKCTTCTQSFREKAHLVSKENTSGVVLFKSFVITVN